MAQAESIPNGSYVAQFPGGSCGVLVSTSKDLKYTAGPCGKSPKYVAQRVKRNGNLITIDQASYKFKIRADGNLIGDWTFGDYQSKKIFKKFE